MERVPARPGTEERFVGHFSDTTHVALAPAGSELYLFPDRTYFYLRWADIMRPTIFDKGRWQCHNGFLVLLSDGSLPETYAFDHEYVPVILTTNQRTARADPEKEKQLLLLLGSESEFSTFVGDRRTLREVARILLEADPELTLRSHPFCLEESITSEGAKKLKDEMYKNYWRPEFFKE
ncbi:MAG: hypothetical protein HQ582_04790 [Planctomycetes bacterium]|nr:hypothetical protein [Planctomycetota bacterium]